MLKKENIVYEYTFMYVCKYKLMYVCSVCMFL